MDFSLLPQLLTHGGTPEQEEEKMNALNEMLASDPVGLLVNLAQIIISSEDQSLLQSASLLLHRPIVKLQQLRPDLSLLPQIHQISDGLFENLFTKSIEYISAFENTHPFCVVAQICIGQYLEADLNEAAATMITTLCQVFSDNSTPKIAFAITEIFKDIAENYQLDPEQYEPIISVLFPILYENQFVNAHKNGFFTILELVDSIDAVITSDENRATLFELLQTSISNPTLRAVVYQIYAKIVESYYQLFSEIAPTVISVLIQSLSQSQLSNDDQVAICCFLHSIAKMELLYTQEGEDHNSLIESNLQELITPIVQMAVSYSEASSDETNSPDAAAIDLASIISTLTPEQMIPLLQQFINENISNEDEGFRAACFSFAYIIANAISSSDFAEFASTMMEAISSVFSDPSPHVIASAMYLLSCIIDKFVESKSYDELFPTISEYVPSLVEHINDSKEVTIVISDIIEKMSEQPNFPFFTDLFRAFLPVFQELNINLVIAISRLLENMIKNHKVVDQIIEIIPEYLQLYMELSQHAAEDHSFSDNQGELASLLPELTSRAPSAFVEPLEAIIDSLTSQFVQTGECESVNVFVLASVIMNIINKLPQTVSPIAFTEKFELFFAMCMHFISRAGNPSDIQDGCNAFIKFLKAKGMLHEFIPQLFEHMVESISQSQESFDSIYQYIKLFNRIISMEKQIPDNTINIILKINEIASNMELYGQDTLKLGYQIANSYNLIMEKFPTEVFQWSAAIFNFIIRLSKLYVNEYEDIDEDDQDYNEYISKEDINNAADRFISSIAQFPEIPEIGEEDREYIYKMMKSMRSDESLRSNIDRYAHVFGFEFNDEEEEAAE